MRSLFRPSRFLARCGLIALGLGLAVLSVQAWVAVSFPVRRPIFRLHPELLHEPVPGARRVLVLDPEVGGGHVHIALDERGYRRPWSGTEPARADLPLVAVFGDSLVLAESTLFEHTFVTRLGEELERLESPVRTVHAGVSGYGPDQTLLRLESRLAELAPDHVVFVVCAHNDYGDMVRNKLFAVGKDGSLEPRPNEIEPLLAARWELRASEGRRMALRRLFDLWKERRAVAAARRVEGDRPLIEWYLEAGRREWEDFLSGDPRVRSLLVDYYDADVVLRPRDPSVIGKRALARAVGKRLAEVCEAAGVGLTVVVAPSAVDLDPEFRIRVDPILHPTYDPARLTQAWCEDLAALTPIDLYPVLAASPDPGACFLGGIDFHWNDLGQELAAQAVAVRVHETLVN